MADSDNIKPIETRYAGYRFRSRLEARWAVFFDHMRLNWEYEPEGYVLPGGQAYLPDFLLPELEVSGMAPGLFVEVKPPRRENLVWDPPDGLPKCAGLATEDVPVLLAVGTPDNCTGFLFAPGTGVTSDPTVNGLCLDGWASGGCLLLPTGRHSVGLLANLGPPRDCRCHLWKAETERAWAQELFDEACEAGKSARFEYGESG